MLKQLLFIKSYVKVVLIISLFLLQAQTKGQIIKEDQPSPMMKLNSIRQLPQLNESQPDLEKALKILESNSEYAKNSLAESSGIEMFQEAFGISSSITSFAQDVIGLPFFKNAI